MELLVTHNDIDLDTSRVHPARRYNYWLGGKDNFAADRESGDAIAMQIPWIKNAATHNRGFLRRAVRFLAAEAGIRQFLDIGTGLPTTENTHQVAQAIAPASRVVYVDNDPIVLVHARAILTSSPEGATAYVDADLSEPESILTAPELAMVLDFGQPVALLLVAVLHFLIDDGVAIDAVKRLVAELPTGSYVALSHAGSDLLTPEDRKTVDALFRPGSPHGPFRIRTYGQVAGFVAGLDPVDPGLVPVQTWRPDAGSESPADEEVGMYGVVARKKQ